MPYRSSVNEEWTRGQGPCVHVTGGGPVYLLVEDVAHARRFYEGILGLPAPVDADVARAEYALPDGSRWVVLAREPTVTLDPDASTVRASLVVVDLEAACERLRARGIAVSDGPRPGASGDLVAEIRDAQDNRILLVSRRAA
jgi:predicted enzyme related to lactoylglutathione lyase